jgi:uncharacterized OsmC-like protein
MNRRRAKPRRTRFSGAGQLPRDRNQFYGKKYGVDVESVETTVEGDLNLGGLLGVKGIRPGFQSVKASTKVKATGDPEKIDKLLKIAEERCPVLDILQKGVPVEVNIERT